MAIATTNRSPLVARLFVLTNHHLLQGNYGVAEPAVSVCGSFQRVARYPGNVCA
jgi:hypothetical protein